jgi:hypothetical protein
VPNNARVKPEPSASRSRCVRRPTATIRFTTMMSDQLGKHQRAFFRLCGVDAGSLAPPCVRAQARGVSL